jgi:hypothetical protein
MANTMDRDDDVSDDGSLWLHIAASVWFVMAPAFSIAGEVIVLDVLMWDEGTRYDDVPDAGVYEATSWEHHDDGTDDKILDLGGAPVSRYMILFFCEALCFLVTALIEVRINRGHRGRVLLCALMAIASLFGIVSSMLVYRDAHLSDVFNAVSVHLFMVEAIVLAYAEFVVETNIILEYYNFLMEKTDPIHQCITDITHVEDGPVREVSTAEPEDHVEPAEAFPPPLGDASLCDKLLDRATFWERIATVFFVAAASMDLALSYYHLAGRESVRVSIAAVVAAASWMCAALIFMGVAVVEYHCLSNIRKKKMEERNIGIAN